MDEKAMTSAIATLLGRSPATASQRRRGHVPWDAAGRLIRAQDFRRQPAARRVRRTDELEQSQPIRPIGVHLWATTHRQSQPIFSIGVYLRRTLDAANRFTVVVATADAVRWCAWGWPRA
jgi:hypothetical protein